MPVIGTGFTKISVDRVQPKGNVTVSNNIKVDNIEETDFGAQKGLKATFSYTSTYEPKGTIMDLRGEVLYMDSKEAVESALKNWKDKKPVDEKVMHQILNAALNKGILQALSLSQDMNLPPPIKLPRVNMKK